MFEKISYFKGNVEKIIEVRDLKKEVAQYLQLDNLNFLIGAGCSTYIEDGKEKGISGMEKLYEDFFSENPEFEVAGNKIKGLFDKNLERMLETMSAIQISNNIKDVDLEIVGKINTVQKYIRNKIIEGLESEKVLEIYKKFYLKTVRNCKTKPINMFTTNYDLFNEQAMDNLGFPYNNGFLGTYKRKFNPISYKYAFVENMNLKKDFWQRVPSFYNLIKLHGSITWVKEEDQIWETNHKFINDDDTVMIYPTPLKDRTTLMTPYSDLFRNMENELLKENCVLFTIGYGFNDDHINRIILNALSIPSFRLVILGKNSSIDKLLKLNDRRIIIINSEDKIQYFENFVDNIMPDLQEDLDEEFNNYSVVKSINKFEKED